MELTGPFLTLAIALGLGMLVGLQRERSPSSTHVGGVRTFPLVTVLGSACAMLGASMGPWLAVAAFLGVVAAGIIANVIGAKRGDPEPGMTTEVAMMVMFIVGVMLASEMLEIAVAIGVGTAILLQLKERLHDWARRLGDRDIHAVMQFALITFIVLPVLPNETYGPFDVLNPYRIWLMVVLVVGISLAGFIAFRVLGKTSGTLAAGLIGGLISSTATTVSYARRVRGTTNGHGAVIAVLILATLVMYGRVIAEIRLVSPTHAAMIATPVAIMAAATLVCAALAMLGHGKDGGEMPEQDNPTELKSALLFGGLYAVILVFVAAAKEWFGDTGIYAVAIISGLTEMDAITLSAGRLVERGRLDPETAWRVVVLASMSNMVFKTGIAWTLGGARLALRLAAWFGVLMLVGAALMLLW
ncbi:hypothetical protein MNBD_PLANCTO03-1415 [hydrothermal vent metagenome]|uniref:Uncharacterized protein n=1 Tax=hydrothermal vent metagenome TaxID=652676 RepID=A0A3B1DIJ5_9ZZZZ